VTPEALATLVCVASGALSGSAKTEDDCRERAIEIRAAADHHGVDDVLLLAIDVLECSMRDDVDAPAYRTVDGVRRRVGVDACPMGVRIVGRGVREGLSRADLYDRGASLVARWRDQHERRKCGLLPRGHHHVAHYNWGNPAYASQVLATVAVLEGRAPRRRHYEASSPRVRGVVCRLARALDVRLPWVGGRKARRS